MEWYHVCWTRLTAKCVEPVVSISWASCIFNDAKWWQRGRMVVVTTALLTILVKLSVGRKPATTGCRCYAQALINGGPRATSGIPATCYLCTCSKLFTSTQQPHNSKQWIQLLLLATHHFRQVLNNHGTQYLRHTNGILTHRWDVSLTAFQPKIAHCQISLHS